MAVFNGSRLAELAAQKKARDAAAQPSSIPKPSSPITSPSIPKPPATSFSNGLSVPQPATPQKTTSSVPQPAYTPTYTSALQNGGLSIPQPATPTTPKTPSTVPQPMTSPKYNEAPVTNYGGSGSALNEILFSKKQFDAGNKDWASNNAKQYYSELEKSDPNLAAQVHNMSTQELIDYINKNSAGTSDAPVQQPQQFPTFVPATAAAPQGTGDLPVFTPPPTTDAPQIDPYQPAIPVMDEDAIRKYSEEQIARKLSDARLTADQAIAKGQLTAQQQSDALKTNYDKMYETINEDRGIENVQNQRRLSPFSGRSDYALGEIERNRARTDRENESTLQTNQGNIAAQSAQLAQQINEKYTALENAAPEEREALFQSIKNDERQYDLMVHGQITNDIMNNSALQNTAFGQALQEFMTNYQVGQDKIDNDANYGGTYGTGQSLQGKASDLANKQANWNAYMDMVNQTGNLGAGPSDTWGSLVNNANSGSQTLNGQNQQLNQMQVIAGLTGYMPDGTKTTQQQQQDLANEWTLSQQTGTISNKIADLYGIPRGTPTQQAAQFMTSYNLQQDQFQSGVDQDLFNYQQKLNQSGQTTGMTAADISKNISNSPLFQGTTDPISGAKVPVNYADPGIRNQVEAMIITQTQDPVVAVQLYNMYGIPVPAQLQQEYQAALSGKTGQ